MTRKSTTQKSHVTVKRAAELRETNLMLSSELDKVCKEKQRLETAVALDLTNAFNRLAKLEDQLKGLDRLDPLLERLAKEFDEVQDKLDAAFEKVDDRFTNLEEWNKKLESRITWYVGRIDNLEKETEALQEVSRVEIQKAINRIMLERKVEDKTSPYDDKLYNDAMFILRNNVKPDKEEIGVVRAALIKYTTLISSRKEFSVWASKWMEEIIRLLGE